MADGRDKAGPASARPDGDSKVNPFDAKEVTVEYIKENDFAPVHVKKYTARSMNKPKRNTGKGYYVTHKSENFVRKVVQKTSQVQPDSSKQKKTRTKTRKETEPQTVLSIPVAPTGKDKSTNENESAKKENETVIPKELSDQFEKKKISENLGSQSANKEEHSVLQLSLSSPTESKPTNETKIKSPKSSPVGKIKLPVAAPETVVRPTVVPKVKSADLVADTINSLLNLFGERKRQSVVSTSSPLPKTITLAKSPRHTYEPANKMEAVFKVAAKNHVPGQNATPQNTPDSDTDSSVFPVCGKKQQEKMSGKEGVKISTTVVELTLGSTSIVSDKDSGTSKPSDTFQENLKEMLSKTTSQKEETQSKPLLKSYTENITETPNTQDDNRVTPVTNKSPNKGEGVGLCKDEQVHTGQEGSRLPGQEKKFKMLARKSSKSPGIVKNYPSRDRKGGNETIATSAPLQNKGNKHKVEQSGNYKPGQSTSLSENTAEPQNDCDKQLSGTDPPTTSCENTAAPVKKKRGRPPRKSMPPVEHQEPTNMPIFTDTAAESISPSKKKGCRGEKSIQQTGTVESKNKGEDETFVPQKRVRGRPPRKSVQLAEVVNSNNNLESQTEVETEESSTELNAEESSSKMKIEKLSKHLEEKKAEPSHKNTECKDLQTDSVLESNLSLDISGNVEAAVKKRGKPPRKRTQQSNENAEMPAHLSESKTEPIIDCVSKNTECSDVETATVSQSDLTLNSSGSAAPTVKKRGRPPRKSTQQSHPEMSVNVSDSSKEPSVGSDSKNTEFRDPETSAVLESNVTLNISENIPALRKSGRLPKNTTQQSNAEMHAHLSESNIEPYVDSDSKNTECKHVETVTLSQSNLTLATSGNVAPIVRKRGRPPRKSAQQSNLEMPTNLAESNTEPFLDSDSKNNEYKNIESAAASDSNLTPNKFGNVAPSVRKRSHPPRKITQQSNREMPAHLFESNIGQYRDTEETGSIHKTDKNLPQESVSLLGKKRGRPGGQLTEPDPTLIKEMDTKAENKVEVTMEKPTGSVKRKRGRPPKKIIQPKSTEQGRILEKVMASARETITPKRKSGRQLKMNVQDTTNDQSANNFNCTLDLNNEGPFHSTPKTVAKRRSTKGGTILTLSDSLDVFDCSASCPVENAEPLCSYIEGVSSQQAQGPIETQGDTPENTSGISAQCSDDNGSNLTCSILDETKSQTGEHITIEGTCKQTVAGTVEYKSEPNTTIPVKTMKARKKRKKTGSPKDTEDQNLPVDYTDGNETNKGRQESEGSIEVSSIVTREESSVNEPNSICKVGDRTDSKSVQSNQTPHSKGPSRKQKVKINDSSDFPKTPDSVGQKVPSTGSNNKVSRKRPTKRKAANSFNEDFQHATLEKQQEPKAKKKRISLPEKVTCPDCGAVYQSTYMKVHRATKCPYHVTVQAEPSNRPDSSKLTGKKLVGASAPLVDQVLSENSVMGITEEQPQTPVIKGRNAARRARSNIKGFIKSIKNQEHRKKPKKPRYRHPKGKQITKYFLQKWKKDLETTGWIKCPLHGCRHKTNSIETISTHYLRCSFHSKKKTYKCVQCDEESLTEQRAKRHARTHTWSDGDSDDESDTPSIPDDEDADPDASFSVGDSDSDKETVNDGSLPTPGSKKGKKSQGSTPKNAEAHVSTRSMPERLEMFFEAMHWTLVWRQKNELKDLGSMTAWWPRSQQWHHLSDIEAESYLPIAPTSPWFAEKESDKLGPQTTLKRFECSIQPLTLLNAGGPVWSMDWLPTPIGKVHDQYLAVYCHRHHDVHHPVLRAVSGPSSIQIWNCHTMQSDAFITSPKLSLVLANNQGAVWCMKWSPRCVWPQDPAKADGRLPWLGTLAVATSNGNVNIYSIPKPESIPCKTSGAVLPVYKATPVLTLKLQTADLKCEDQVCRCLDWQYLGGCCRLLVGYAGGRVALYDLLTMSPLLRTQGTDGKPDTLHPFISFMAHQCPVTSLAFCQRRPNFFTTVSQDRTMKVWDLDALDYPVNAVAKSEYTKVVWPLHWAAIFAATDNCFCLEHNALFMIDTGYFGIQNRPLTVHNGCIMDATYSEWLNTVISVDSSGIVEAMYLPYLMLTHKHHKSFSSRRMVMFATCCEPLTPCECEQSSEPIRKSLDSASTSHPRTACPTCRHPLPSTTVPVCVAESRASGLADEEEGRHSPTLLSSVTKVMKNMVEDLSPAPPLTITEMTEQYAVTFEDKSMSMLNTKKDTRIRSAKDLRADILMPPLAAQYKAQWNPNLGSHLWLAVAGEAGLVRLVYLSAFGSQKEKDFVKEVFREKSQEKQNDS